MENIKTSVPMHGGPPASDAALRAALGIARRVPLSRREMAEQLRVTFFPSGRRSARLAAFCTDLGQALKKVGVQVIPYESARTGGHRGGKLQEGIVVIAAGELETGDLPVDHVSNLRATTLVGIVEGPCPAWAKDASQEKLNSIVETLAYNIIQVAIYVDESAWTITTMNGAVIRCDDWNRFADDVFQTLVPKLAAPVVPPHASDFEFHEEAVDLGAADYARYVNDFKVSGPLWGKTGLLLFHTSLDSLAFRSNFYRRIAAAYLDRRSGMSYGFLARQTAATVQPARRLEDPGSDVSRDLLREQGFAWSGSRLVVRFDAGADQYAVDVPEVAVVCTRSGCDKSNIDGTRDLMIIALSGGRVIIHTPKGLSPGIDSRPSYDTQTILAHALGNALIASVQATIDPDAAFGRTVRESGMALAHWHGGFDPRWLPAGYAVHGESNPPVSCSTHQAALFALAGKLEAFRSCIERGVSFAGDVHVEPHHGINVTWPTLHGLATTLLRHDGLHHREMVNTSQAVPGE